MHTFSAHNLHPCVDLKQSLACNMYTARLPHFHIARLPHFLTARLPHFHTATLPFCQQTSQDPSHANLEVLKKRAQKNLEIRTSTLENSKMCQIKTTTTDCLFQSALSLISALCCTRSLLFLHLGSLSTLTAGD